MNTKKLKPEIRVSINWGASAPGPGTEMRIRWQVSGTPDSLFRLDLYSGGAYKTTIEDDVRMTAEYHWIIPDTLAGLPACRIRVTSCRDPSVYDYTAIQFDIQLSSGIERTLPVTTRLYCNYPNPFNPVTVIRYDLAAAEHVRIIVINLRGEIAIRFEQDQPAGCFRFRFDADQVPGGPLPGGLYFCRFRAGKVTAVRKMVLVR